MADPVPGIAEGFAGLGNKLPVVAGRVQRQLDDAERESIAHLAVGDWCAERVVILAARADNELANAARGVGYAGGILRRETLIIMGVAVDHQLGASIIQRLPDRLHRNGVTMFAGTKARVVPVSQRAVGRVRAQI